VFTIEQYGYGVLRYRRRMSVSLASTMDEAHEKRWREWQAGNEDDQRHGARRARLVFTVIFIALGVSLGLQFVS